MKRVLSIIVIGIVVISGFGAFAVPTLEIKQEKTTLYFSKLSVNEKNEFVTLELEGANSVLLKKDRYMIPTLVKTFTFPFETEIIDVQCIPKNINKQILTKKLIISPDPVIASQSIFNKKLQNTQSPISIDTWYDYDIGVGLNGNERCVFVKVQTFPIQYSPSENLLKWAENIDINIDYKIPEQPITFGDEYAFIVLTPSEFSDELQDLISHKIGRGISTKLVTLDEIYGGSYFPAEGRDNPEKIKYFIKNAYDSWGTKNVLLVGGNDEFPVRATHVYVDYNDGDAEVFASDLYYADIYDEDNNFSSWDSNENNLFGEYNWDGKTDDIDLYPDVHLGRLACVDSTEVNTCVNKIINYETNEAFLQDWFTNIVVIGGDTSPGDDDAIDEGEYVNQAILDIMDGFIPTKLWASDGNLGISSYIDSAINDGAGFVDFSGHGNPTTWSTHPHGNENMWIPVGGYKNTHASSLINGDELPIVVTGACSPGKFTVRDDCLTWSFVSNPNGGGIGSFGPTALSWGYDGTWCIRGLGGKMQLELFEAYNDEGAITFGEMWSRAINGYISIGMDCGDYKTLEEWQPFGDPTLAIADESLAPITPDAPEGTTSGGADVEYTYNASTTDPDEDKIYYLFDWGDSKFSGWIGPYDSGQTAQASHKWTEKGDYEIKVKAKDNHGVQSDWSDPLPISMPKAKQLFSLLLFDFFEKFPLLFPILRNIFEC